MDRGLLVVLLSPIGGVRDIDIAARVSLFQINVCAFPQFILFVLPDLFAEIVRVI